VEASDASDPSVYAGEGGLLVCFCVFLTRIYKLNKQTTLPLTMLLMSGCLAIFCDCVQ
jgi:hypothetical protein